eukprot:6947208-Ditylum_brightwellii.AAC.1
MFLQCAACLGASFTLETINMIWQHQQREINADSLSTRHSTEELIMEMVEEHYLEVEAHKNDKCRWVHDSVQEVAMSLIKEEDHDSFRRSIGEIWYQELGEENLEPSLFEVTNLLNAIRTGVTNIDFARLNLKAAEKARDVAAFDRSIHYASSGISMLPSNKWDSCPELTVKLYSLAAEAESFLGHHAKMESYCREVLSQESISILEKKDVYLTKLNSLIYAEMRFEDAIGLFLTILADLGCRFPRYRIVGRLEAL